MTLLKMGALRELASRRGTFLLLAIVTGTLASTPEALAASYSPSAWYLTTSFSFDVLNPVELNGKTNNIAPLPGLIGGRAKIERGLVAPDWSHWIEFDYFTGSATASDEGTSYTQSISYMAILPLGVTYWVNKSAYIDFGISLGAGLALAPHYALTIGPDSGGGTEVQYTGKIGPAFVGRLDGRFWFSPYVAATLSSGIHYYGTDLTSGALPTARAELTSISLIGGITIAIGGVKGTGRSFVEVLKNKPDPIPKTR